jgi:hypothetical protein
LVRTRVEDAGKNLLMSLLCIRLAGKIAYERMLRMLANELAGYNLGLEKKFESDSSL